MNKIWIVVASSLCLSACDGVLKYHGTVLSESGGQLAGCHKSLKVKDGRSVYSSLSFSPPSLSGNQVVGLGSKDYVLILSCAGHLPREVEMRFDARAPVGSIDLGTVVLAPSPGA